MAGEAQDVQGIAIGLGLDTAGWSSGIAKAKGELQGLIESAQDISVGMSLPKGGRAPAGTAVGGRVSPSVTPGFSVTSHAVRDMRADINQTLRAQANQGQAVGIPIKLGRIPWGTLRTQIAEGIGVVPIKVTVGQITPQARNILSAMMSVGSGVSMGRAQATIESAGAARAIPKRASGGVVYSHQRPQVIPRARGFNAPRMTHAEYQSASFDPTLGSSNRPRPRQAPYQRSALSNFYEPPTSTPQEPWPTPTVRRVEHAYRGKQVRGYGGKYGSAGPGTIRGWHEHNDRVWGDPIAGTYRQVGQSIRRGEWLYHATSRIPEIRGAFPNLSRGYGVAPDARGQSYWSTTPLSYFGPNMVRTRAPADAGKDERLSIVWQNALGATINRRVPRRDLQYWGEDKSWHRFRRGRARARGTPTYAGDVYRNLKRATRGLTDEQVAFGREWYPHQQAWIESLARQYNKPEPMVRGMAASLSAGTAWGANKTKLKRILDANAKGEDFPYPDALDAHRKARLILGGADPWSLLRKSPKVGAFYRNLGGELGVSTKDRWLLRTATRGAIDKVNVGGVLGQNIEEALQRIARERHMQVAELQAALWGQEKQASDLKKYGRITNLSKYMQRGGGVKGRPVGVRFETNRIFPPGQRGTFNPLEVSAYRGGRKIGYSNFEQNRRGFYPGVVQVDPAYQGRGIGSWMYATAEKELGDFVHPSDIQTPLAQRMWSDPRRPFGGDPDAAPGQMGMFWKARRWPHKAFGGLVRRALRRPQQDFIAQPRWPTRSSVEGIGTPRPNLWWASGQDYLERVGRDSTLAQFMPKAPLRHAEGGEVEGPIARRIREVREAREGIVRTPMVPNAPTGPSEPFEPAWRRWTRENKVAKDLTRRLKGGRVRPSRSLEARALRMFGETDEIGEAGYIAPSGRMLDFSGRHEAAGYRRQGDRFVPESRRHPEDYLGGTRNVDHRQAWPLFKNLSGPDAMERMMQRGYVRVFSADPDAGQFMGSINKPLTSAQERRILGSMSEWGQDRLTGIMDVHKRMGRTVYPVGEADLDVPATPLRRVMAEANRLARRRRMAGGPTFKVGDPEGIHMRPSAFLTRMARKFNAQVLARNETIDREALAPLLKNEPMSMYGWLSLGARKGHRIELTGKGEEADKAVHALGKLIQNPRLTELARRQSMRRSQSPLLGDVGRPTLLERAAATGRRLFGGRVAPLGPGEVMPPALGMSPLREGYARGYHSTRGDTEEQVQQRLKDIRTHGLKLSKARGSEYGEPERVWFSDRAEAYGEKYAVEAHLPKRWFGRFSPRPGDPYTEGGPESNMAVARDVSRRRIASWNAPWMHHYRYMQERVGEGQTPAQVMRELGSTVVSMRGDKGYGDITKGYDQFVADAWRARRRPKHRFLGGLVAGFLEGLVGAPGMLGAEVGIGSMLGFGAGSAVSSIPGMFAQQEGKGGRVHRAGGGDVGGQPYIVNELGSEMFVPNRIADIIPPHVFDQLPKREQGGPVMIPGGEQLWTPPEDGWIIPAHLVGQVPHRAEGTPETRAQRLRRLAREAMGRVGDRFDPERFINRAASGRPRQAPTPRVNPSQPAPATDDLSDAAYIRSLPNVEDRTRFFRQTPSQMSAEIGRWRAGRGGGGGGGGGPQEQRAAAEAEAEGPPLTMAYEAGMPLGQEPELQPRTQAAAQDLGVGISRRSRIATKSQVGQGRRLARGAQEIKVARIRRSREVAHRQALIEGRITPEQYGVRTRRAPERIGAAAMLEDIEAPIRASRIEPGLREAQERVAVAKLGRRGMTPRSIATGLGEFTPLGGGKARAEAEQQMRDLQRTLTAMVPSKLQGTTSAVEYWTHSLGKAETMVQKMGNRQAVTTTQYENAVRARDTYIASGGHEQKTLVELARSVRRTSVGVEGATRQLNDYTRAQQGANESLMKAKEFTTDFEKASKKAQGNNARNFLAATVSLQAFQMGMQSMQVGMDLAKKAAAPLIDQMGGFGSTATRVSTDLAKSAAETGNVQAAIAKAAGAGGLGAAGLAYVGQNLTAAVTAKAAGAASGQAMDLRRAAYGAGNAPTGLYGGYGGLFGTSFLASELFGGGKGFTENIAGEAAGARSSAFGAINYPRGGGGPRTAGQAAGAMAQAVANATPEQMEKYKTALEGLTTEAHDYNESLDRGSRYLGQNTSALRLMTTEELKLTKGLSDADIGALATKFADVGAAAGDAANAQNMAANGLFLVDKASGQIVKSAKDYKTYFSQAAQGTILPTAETYAAQQKVQLEGAQAVADAQRQMLQRIQIPGQLGMQLAAQPLLPAQAGIATQKQMTTGRIGGLEGMGAAASYVQASLRETQKMQNEITKAGAKAIETQAQFIRDNISIYTNARGETLTAGQAPQASVEKLAVGLGKSVGSIPSEIGKLVKSAASGTSIPDLLKQAISAVGNIAAPTAAAITGAPATGAAGETAAADYLAIYGKVNDVLGKGEPTIYAYGNAITALNAQIAKRQTTLSVAQYSEQIRVLNRNITYARGLVSGQGATSGPNANLGAMERMQFTLSRAAETLSMALTQRQINFQTALAGFQAPGITGQERAARMEEAKVEASYAQQQLNIQRQQFTVAGSVFNTQARNSLTDLEHQRSLSAQTFAVEQATLADQKRISVLTIKQGQLQATAQSILDHAQAGFGNTLGSAGGYVSQFSGTIRDAINAIRTAQGQTPVNWSAGGTTSNPSGNRNTGARATGYLGSASTPTDVTYGEAGTETIAIVRNPRPMRSPVPSFGGGGGINMPITITGNTISSSTDLHALARAVGEEVERRLGQKASLLNAPSAF